MTKIFRQTIRYMALGITTTVFINSLLIQPSDARKVDLDTLCRRFPLNSRCAGYQSALESVGQASGAIKLRLKTSGVRNEWIRIERQGDRVKLIHTTRDRTVASKVFNGILGAVSPFPVPNINSHQWYDHPTTRVVFMPDSCSVAQQSGAVGNSSIKPNSACAVIGTSSMTLPRGTDIYKGRFTIDYQEGDLLRSITFRVPNDSK